MQKLLLPPRVSSIQARRVHSGKRVCYGLLSTALCICPVSLMKAVSVAAQEPTITVPEPAKPPIPQTAVPDTPPVDPLSDPSGFVDLKSVAPILTFKTQTRRVIVDVVVTDPKGHPVTGLSKGDFTVFEDKQPQPVRSFEEHTVAVASPYVAPKLPQLPPNTYINLARAPETGTPTVILYDVLNTSPTEQLYAHQEVVSFIKHRKPGTQIAIFVLGDRLRLLQGFTDDADRLAASLEAKVGVPQQSSQLSPSNANASTAGSFAPAAPSGPPPQGSTAPNEAQATGAPTLSNLESLDQSYQLDRRVEITLDALTEVGRFLVSIPGRKNLIWLSSSFPAGILPDGNITVTTVGEDTGRRNYSRQIKEATDLLNVSHVAVYPVDVRGVTINSAFSASSNKDLSAPGAYGTAVSAFTTSQNADHSTMDSIAESTGGRAFYNTNDLQQAVDLAMNTGSTYYSLTYSPTNPNFDGTLRNISVKLQKTGYTLSYRKTYFADDLNAAAQAVQDAPQSPLTPSLEHGTPLAHELLVSAHLDAVGEPVAATPKQMELLSQYEAMRSKKKKSQVAPGALPPVMMQRYLIQYGLLPRQLQLPTTPTGAHVASLELGVISYDSDGRKLNGIDTRIDETISATGYETISKEGYHIVQSVVIPVTATAVRLAVRDAHANRIGSLEVQLPLAKIQSTSESQPPRLKSLGANPGNQ